MISNSELFTWVILPLLIAVARVCDVTIGTIRIMFLSRGQKWITPILGFFEILIWLLAIRQIMQNLSNIACYLAYASGFALGNLIGMLIDEKLALGKLVVRIITRKESSELIKSLNRKGFGVTNIPAEGSRGNVNIIFTIIERSDLKKVINTIQKFNPKAFYTIEDVRAAKEGVFPIKKGFIYRTFLKPPRFYRRMRVYWRLWRIRKGK